MGISIEYYEKVVKETIELLTSRPVQYTNERKAQPTVPFVTVGTLSEVLTGLPQVAYFQKPAPSVDFEAQVVRPVEVAFSVRFIGGNARGELSETLANLISETATNFLRTGNLGFLRDSGVNDISVELGADSEQRAQSDITFSGFVLPEPVDVPSVQTVTIDETCKNTANQTVEEKEINI